MRIAVVAACPFPYPRGTPVRILRLAEETAALGHEVHVVTYHLGEGEVSPALRLHRIRDVRSYRKVSPGPTYKKLLLLDPLLGRELRAVIGRHRIDLVHAHHIEGLLTALGARWGRRLPVVFDAHTLLESELPYYGLGLRRGIKRSLGRAIDRNLPRRADHVIAVTQRIRTAVLNGGGLSPDSVSVVTNGVEEGIFDVDAGTAGPPGPDEPPRIVFAGNLSRYQGIDWMLHAFARVAAERPDARLLLVTESSFDEYESLAGRLGIRDRIDRIDAPFAELPVLLAGANVALNPRVECDGIPQKLLNYMAAAKPVVSFAGSAKCLEDGRTGLVVPDGDTEAFAAAVLRLLDDRALGERLGAAARAYIAAEHSWAGKAAQVETIYRKVLGR